MPLANYLECGSELKVQIELGYPLNASQDCEPVYSSERDEVRKCVKAPP